MKNTLRLLLGLAVLASLLAVMPTVQADTWNKKTILTFSEPVELPGGTILPAGKYVFKLADSQSNRHIVQVFDEDEKKLQTTILAIPNWRLQPTGDTVITFHETPAGQPKPVRAWFYPGDNFGQEFAFPESRATQITAATQVEVPRLSSEDESMLAGRVQTETTTESAQVQAPVEAPAVDRQADMPVATPEPAPAAPAPEPAPAEPAAAPPAEPMAQDTMSEREELPQTGSPLPLLALSGLLSLAGAAGLRRFVR